MKLRFSYMSLISVFLGITIIVSALFVVYSKHKCRTLNTQIQNIDTSKTITQQTWHNLLIERGTFLTDRRVELIAINYLNMYIPRFRRVVFIKL